MANDRRRVYQRRPAAAGKGGGGGRHRRPAKERGRRVATATEKGRSGAGTRGVLPASPARAYSSALVGAAVGVTAAGTGALAGGGVAATGRLGAVCAYLPRRSRMSCA